jgi:hypothetical protein
MIKRGDDSQTKIDFQNRLSIDQAIAARDKWWSEKIQKYIGTNNVYQVEFGHYENLIQWVPMRIKRVNISEILA